MKLKFLLFCVICQAVFLNFVEPTSDAGFQQSLILIPIPIPGCIKKPNSNKIPAKISWFYTQHVFARITMVYGQYTIVNDIIPDMVTD